MRRLFALLAVLAIAASAPSALAGGHATRAELKLRKTRVGTILVDRRGFTLYAFTSDRPNHDSCASIPHCLAVWPVMASARKPIAGPGVKGSLIGTIMVRGQRQVTYAGHPLYGYVADTRPGQTSYVNILQFGGRWPAVDRNGHEVK